MRRRSVSWYLWLKDGVLYVCECVYVVMFICVYVWDVRDFSINELNEMPSDYNYLQNCWFVVARRQLFGAFNTERWSELHWPTIYRLFWWLKQRNLVTNVLGITDLQKKKRRSCEIYHGFTMRICLRGLPYRCLHTRAESIGWERLKFQMS